MAENRFSRYISDQIQQKEDRIRESFTVKPEKDPERELWEYVLFHVERENWCIYVRTSIADLIVQPLDEKYGRNWKAEDHPEEVAKVIQEYMDNKYVFDDYRDSQHFHDCKGWHRNIFEVCPRL